MRRSLPAALCLGLLTALTIAPAARTDWLLTQTPFHNQEPGSVGIGYAPRFGQSPYVGVDNIGSTYNEYKYDLVPLYLYEGDYLFAHGTEWGVHLFRPQKTFNVDLIARYRDEMHAHDRRHVPGGVRASLGLYSTEADIEALMPGLGPVAARLAGLHSDE